MCVAYGAGGGGGAESLVHSAILWLLFWVASRSRFCRTPGQDVAATPPPPCGWLGRTRLAVTAMLPPRKIHSQLSHSLSFCLHRSARPCATQGDELLRTYEEEALPLHWTDVEKLGKSDTLHDTVRDKMSHHRGRRNARVTLIGGRMATYVCVEVVAQDPDATWTPETAASYVLAVPYAHTFIF